MNIEYFKEKLVWVQENWVTVLMAFIAFTFIIWLLKKLWNDIISKD